MAENEAPSSHGPRLDFDTLQNKNNKRNSSRNSTINIQRIPMTASDHNSINNDRGLISPPPSQSSEMDHDQETRQLISPPPEEELRSSRQSVTSTSSNPKRKRSVQPIQSHYYSSPQATPNPKPRKQSKQTQPATSPIKHSYNALESPHKRNPNADFIPSFMMKGRLSDESAGSSSRRGRRSQTPIVIPPYEPPEEVFTPPMEVTITPSPTKPKKTSRKSVRKTLSIKVEPPADMDAILREPMPPASPTDDPLLLSDSVEPESHPRREDHMDIVAVTPRRPVRQMESLPPSSPPSPASPIPNLDNDNDLPISSSPVDGVDYFFPQEPPNTSELNNMSTSDDDVDMDISLAEVEGPIPKFVLPPRGKVDEIFDSWSDDEEDEGVGAEHLRSRGEEVNGGEGEFTGRWRMWKIRTKTDPPSEATQSRMDSWGRPISPYPYELQCRGSPTPGSSRNATIRLGSPKGDEQDEDAGEDRETTVVLGPGAPAEEQPGEADEEAELEEEEEVRAMSIEPEGAREIDTSLEEEEVRAMSIEPELQQASVDSDESDEAEEEEEAEVREMSVVHDDEEEEEEQAHEEPSTVPYSSPQPQPSFSFIGSPTRTPLPTTVPLLRDLSFLQKAPGTPRNRPQRLTARTRTPVRAATSSRNEEEEEVEQLSPQPSDQIEEEDGLGIVSTQYQDVEVELPDDDESSDEEDDDPGLVKITSSDPRAAARAAAILKQHDYDCYTKITAKEKKRRHSSYSGATNPLDSIRREDRRRTVTSGGITKSLSPKQREKRRHSMGTVVGDNVYMPGSPVVTLTGLLDEASREMETGRNTNKVFSETPLPTKRSRLSLGHDEELQWTKEDWKTLDACFTDERIALANLELDDEFEFDDMADVDVVDLDKVVNRFLALVEVELDETSGEPWSLDSIRARAEAIRKKQRSGKIAPPTPAGTGLRLPSRIGSQLDLSNSSFAFSTPSVPFNKRPVQIPSFTPGLTPLPKRYTLPPAIGADAPFSSIKMPKANALMAPRYGYLLDEAKRVDMGEPSTSRTTTEEEEDEEDSFEVEASLDLSRESDSVEFEDEEPSSASVLEPQGLGGRMKGIFFSYLPTLSKQPAAPQSKRPTQPNTSLPLPPPEVLSKHRGPIATPARPSIPRGPAPKELVTLNHQDLPTETKIPQRKEKPKRMVELRNVTPPSDPQLRKSSSAGGLKRKGSVKDLVKDFEEMERSSSSLGIRKTATKQKGKEVARPAWR